MVVEVRAPVLEREDRDLALSRQLAQRALEVDVLGDEKDRAGLTAFRSLAPSSSPAMPAASVDIGTGPGEAAPWRRRWPNAVPRLLSTQPGEAVWLIATLDSESVGRD